MHVSTHWSQAATSLFALEEDFVKIYVYVLNFWHDLGNHSM